MTQAKLYPTWKDIVVFATDGPRHQKLIETDTFRAVLVGLEAGGKIPPHSTLAAAYHFLEGSGWMIVDGERLAVEPGATVVVPSGVPRGVEAETRLAFLGTQAASIRKPFVKSGLMIMFGLMMGAMMIMAMMLFGSGGMGLGMWGMMIFPFLGLLMMLFIMFFVFRRMASSSGPMSGMMGHSHAPQSQSKENTMTTLTTLTYNIPAVHCGHCKMTIERAVGELSGVAFVSVDVDTKQVVIKLNSPATKAKIEALLTEIGYPPESQ